MKFFDLYLESVSREYKIQPGVFDLLEQYSKKPGYFISFRENPDDMYINKENKYGTPHGIYTYPLNKATANKYIDFTNKILNFPFAAERPYIYIIKAKPGTNILVLDDRLYDKEKYDADIKKILEWSYLSKTEIKKAERESDIKRIYGGKLWNVTRVASDYNTIRWNRILVKLGYDLIIDFGHGIIYGGEPYQAVFLGPYYDIEKVINNNTTGNYLNQSLDKSVKNIIKGWSYSSNNAKSIIENLYDRYGQYHTRRMIANLTARFISNYSDDYNGLSKLFKGLILSIDDSKKDILKDLFEEIIKRDEIPLNTFKYLIHEMGKRSITDKINNAFWNYVFIQNMSLAREDDFNIFMGKLFFVFEELNVVFSDKAWIFYIGDSIKNENSKYEYLHRLIASKAYEKRMDLYPEIIVYDIANLCEVTDGQSGIEFLKTYLSKYGDAPSLKKNYSELIEIINRIKKDDRSFYDECMKVIQKYI